MNIFSKIGLFEKILKDEIMVFIDNNVLSSNQ